MSGAMPGQVGLWECQKSGNDTSKRDTEYSSVYVHTEYTDSGPSGKETTDLPGAVFGCRRARMAAKTGCFKHKGVVAEADSAGSAAQKEEARQEKETLQDAQ